MRQKIMALLLAFSVALTLCSPARAVGDGNIDSGDGSGEGSGMGTGSKQNFWNNEDGIRISVLKDGVKVACFDWSNKNESNVQKSFIRKTKLDYLHGSNLLPSASQYLSTKPAVKLPTIVGGSGGNNIAAIKRYFTDTGHLHSIATDTGISFNDLISGDYRLLLEPVAYV